MTATGFSADDAARSRATEYNTQAGRRIFSDPNMSQTNKTLWKKLTTEDLFCWMLHPGVTCDQAIQATHARPHMLCQICLIKTLNSVSAQKISKNWIS